MLSQRRLRKTTGREGNDQYPYEEYLITNDTKTIQLHLSLLGDWFTINDKKTCALEDNGIAEEFRAATGLTIGTVVKAFEKISDASSKKQLPQKNSTLKS